MRRGLGWGRALGRAGPVPLLVICISVPMAKSTHHSKQPPHPPAPQPSSGCVSYLVAEGWAGSQPGAGRGAGSQEGLCPSLGQLTGRASPCCRGRATGKGRSLLSASVPISRLGRRLGPALPGSPGTLAAQQLGHGDLLQTDLAQHRIHPLNSVFIWHMLPSSLESSSVLVAGSIHPAGHTPTASPARWGKQGIVSRGVWGGHVMGSARHAACGPSGREGAGGLTLHRPQVPGSPLPHSQAGPASAGSWPCRTPVPAASCYQPPKSHLFSLPFVVVALSVLTPDPAELLFSSFDNCVYQVLGGQLFSPCQSSAILSPARDASWPFPAWRVHGGCSLAWGCGSCQASQ